MSGNSDFSPDANTSQCSCLVAAMGVRWPGACAVFLQTWGEF